MVFRSLSSARKRAVSIAFHAFVLISAIAPFRSDAATIETLVDSPLGVSIVSLTGPIERGDVGKFLTATEHYTKAIVFLESPGGNVSEALSIGAEIRLRGFSTSVVENAECFSACALIWLGGNNRYMWENSQIGFHAAYYRAIDGPKQSGVANAEIGAYLTHLGLSIEAIRFATIAGPSELMFLSPSIAQALGIDAVLNENGRVFSPAQRPSGETLARIFVSISTWEHMCSELIARVSPAMIDARTQAHTSGNELLGKELWLDYYLRQLEEMKMLFTSNGTFMGCIELDDLMFDIGVPTAVSAPGYNCSKATTPTEIAICSHPKLWADDHLMNAVYLMYRDSPKSPKRSDYFSAQRAWLKLRDSCEDDLQCLEDIYDLRLKSIARNLGL